MNNEIVPVCHIVKGEVVRGSEQVHGRFATPRPGVLWEGARKGGERAACSTAQRCGQAPRAKHPAASAVRRANVGFADRKRAAQCG